ncbi:MAG: MoxR family ATPase [Candidatus Protochlamydia sp.]|nr:MoxR family ATPase [Candidatus Protochlamydia sp.]
MTNTIQMMIDEAKIKIDQIKQEMGKVIIGQTHLIRCLLISVFADGHILIEGVPGLAKTLAATTLAKVIECNFKRVQFTPDLLPADLIGTPIYNPNEGTFTTKKGPIFTNILLADEINRAPAKVQSALLEVMQEKQVTIGVETFQAPRPFLVLATQNPIEQEGTYPLSEAQTDRFMMKTILTYPSKEEEREILNRMGTLSPLPAVNAILSLEEIQSFRELVNAIYIDDKIADYILNIVAATRDPGQFGLDRLGDWLEYGASPRATLALKQGAKAQALLSGRYFVNPQDVKSICHDILRHRLRLTYEGEAENLSTDAIITQILEGIPVP